MTNHRTNVDIDRIRVEKSARKWKLYRNEKQQEQNGRIVCSVSSGVSHAKLTDLSVSFTLILTLTLVFFYSNSVHCSLIPHSIHLTIFLLLSPIFQIVSRAEFIWIVRTVYFTISLNFRFTCPVYGLVWSGLVIQKFWYYIYYFTFLVICTKKII